MAIRFFGGEMLINQDSILPAFYFTSFLFLKVFDGTRCNYDSLSAKSGQVVWQLFVMLVSYDYIPNRQQKRQ